jgi:hypothetical protein
MFQPRSRPRRERRWGCRRWHGPDGRDRLIDGAERAGDRGRGRENSGAVDGVEQAAAGHDVLQRSAAADRTRGLGDGRGEIGHSGVGGIGY